MMKATVEDLAKRVSILEKTHQYQETRPPTTFPSTMPTEPTAPSQECASGFWKHVAVAPLQAEPKAPPKPSMADMAARIPSGFKGFQGNERRRPKRPVPKGTGTASKRLPAGPKTIRLVITNADQSVQEDDIKEYFKEKELQPPTEVKDWSSDGWSTKRFIVTVPSSMNDAVMEPSFWPENIVFKKYFEKRRS
jgi:hypothetical protein